jgi:cytoskeleton protein RodZ
VSEDGATAPAVAGPGALLKAERERRGLSLPDVAESLHVDPRLAAALEANDFAAFGAPVYARGFLRQYALLLGLEPEQVLSQPAGLPPPLVPTARATPEPTDWRALRRAALALLIALIAGVVVGWILTRPGPRRALAPPPATFPKRESVVPAAAQAPEPEPEPTPTPAPAPEAGAAFEPAQPVSAGVPSTRSARAAAPTTPGALSVVFNADCWVEVYDADGRRVLYDLGHAGQTRSVPGPAPWRVMVGDVDAVRLSVAGRPVSPRWVRRRGTTGQFTVTADGGSG